MILIPQLGMPPKIMWPPSKGYGVQIETSNRKARALFACKWLRAPANADPLIRNQRVQGSSP